MNMQFLSYFFYCKELFDGAKAAVVGALQRAGAVASRKSPCFGGIGDGFTPAPKRAGFHVLVIGDPVRAAPEVWQQVLLVRRQ